MILYYFGGKRELYLAILREYFQKANKITDAINENESSPVKKLEKIFTEIGETYKNSPYTIKLLLTELNQPGESFSDIETKVKSLQKISIDIIRDGIDEKIFRSDVNPESIALVLFSIAHFAFILPNFAKNLLSDESFDDYFAQTQEIFFRGIMR